PAAGAFGEESGPTRLNGAQGESVTFALVVPRGSRVDSVAWNGKSIIAIVTPGEPAPLRVIHTHYRDRLRVPDGSYSLQVTDLRPEDTGTYTAQIATQGSPDPIFRRFALRVYKRLAESDITVTPVLGSVNTVNGTCSITLNCTVQGAGEDVNCTWNQTEAGTVISTGASIHISHRLGDEGASVTCTARNPVSSSSRSVSLQDVCAEPPGCREMDVAAIAGESVQLQPVTWPESWVKISWEVTLDSGETYRLLTANKGEAPHLRSVLHFASRVTLHPENLSLQIDPVNKSDRGLYALEITAAGGRVDRTTFRVSVFERVRQPNLTVLSAHTQHGQCNLTLSCSVPGADAVTYSWS
uniref:Ig-like domain-containing protein n=1 Tax=Pelodiscus sinensis TaxID=13735 RepID=K7G740_PELSI